MAITMTARQIAWMRISIKAKLGAKQLKVCCACLRSEIERANARQTFKPNFYRELRGRSPGS